MKRIEYFLPLVFVFTLISSCDKSQENTTEKKVFWVNSQRSQCDAGAGVKQCISVSENTNLTDAEWRLFYSDIEGFKFESGYYQKIKVTVEKLNKENVPADAGTMRYKLAEVLDKKLDPKLRLHDIWATQKINGEPIPKDIKTPILEINITKMQVLGSNGCNNYNGGIKRITENEIEFAPIAGTRMMCPNMSIPDAYDKALAASISYKMNKLELTFFDANGEETLNFIKVD